MDAHEMRLKEAHKGYGNLGDDQHGLQKVANDAARGEVLKEFASEMDSHDAKRSPAGRSPLNSLYVPLKEDIKEEHLLPLDFDERLQKFLRD